ncbi:hypothetical protein N5079_01845 [Planotetraspora sp. A-T 1434]|uniref:hypothetical protein n=1 Tax=Planotetraspora sp. A-T 1434 TaxID=2979219 RepID=UPI0021C0D858|nr:hypothetical protein [Planotetraspora sp. A-T 1434]MCT9928956.1 hypothetical protein [Planotetraspora sp. A-T 1434]
MRTSKLLATALVAAAALTAGAVPVQAATLVGPGRSAAVAEAASAVSIYDGETIYRGLILGIGPVADLFPEFRRPVAEVTEEQARFADDVIASINAKDREFLTTFGTEMTSGDRVRIDQAFADAQEITRRVLEDGFGLRPGPPPTEQAFGWGVFVIAIYLGNAYEVVNVYKIYNAWRESNVYKVANFTDSIVNGDMARLDRERFVDLIAERLAA